MEIKEAKTRKEKQAFIKFPFLLYENNPLWVPPLLSEMKRIIQNTESPLFQSGPHAFYLALEGREAVGRIAVGIDEKFNHFRKKKEGYITLFECINSKEVANALFVVAEDWLKKRKVDAFIGPLSPTNGDDFRGLLIENFEDPPLIFTSFNPPWYVSFFEEYGFEKYHTFVAYRYDLERMPFDSCQRAIEYAKSKFNFKVRPINYAEFDREVRAIQSILAQSLISLEYDYLVPPAVEELSRMAKEFKKFIPPNFAQIAWAGEEPVGFAVAIPDYNQVLKKMKGKLLPLGWLTFLLGRHQINRGRAFLLFVIPQYQGKGVPAALLWEIFKEVRKRGYVFAEGSSINAKNVKMCREAESLGGVPYKKFALYRKRLKE